MLTIMFSFRLLSFLSLFFSCFCEQRLLVDQLRWDFLELENELWNFSANGLFHQPDAELYLVKKFYGFDQKLSQIPQNILYGVEPVRTVPSFLFFYSELKIIETTYDKFKEYLSLQLADATFKIGLEDIIYDITNNKTGMNKTIDSVYEHEDSIKEEIYEKLSDNYWCKETQQSPQQMFYNLYNLIALNDLKAYILQQFAFLGNRLWEKGNFTKLSISTRKDYEKRVTHISNKLITAVKQPQDIWRCDPKMFIKGRNYDEFTRLLQGHIENEVDMSSRRTCRQTCNGYSYTKSYGCYDNKRKYCQKVERCNGNIIGCFFVESHASICVSKSPSRRYEFVRYDSGRTYGKNTYCSESRSVHSWQRWFVRCHYCMCLCDQQGRLSDRYINLRPVMADVQNNRVVTGMRLVKHNRILHMQIQEGKLLPYGYINESTVHWVKLDDYKITDPGVKDRDDFFTMTYGERSMAMDEIQVNDDNHVVTGVRFELINGIIHFEIHVSPFNWHTGELDNTQGYYIQDSNPKGRSKINIKDADIPIKTDGPSEMTLSGAKTYVEFTHTGFYQDAAQTTVPFLDIQEVISKPAVPLMGAGIYYKGKAGYGGFIAPRIKTYNYGKHVSTKIPEITERQDIEDYEEVVALN